MANLSIERLREVLNYDPGTGVFRWRISRNNARAGKIAGCADNKGYWQIMIDGKNYKAHRLAWMLTYGVVPKRGIDHIDGNPTNNALSNLRECCQSKNAANTKRRWDNKTGYKGIHFRKDTGRYAAYLTVSYRRKCLGCYETAEEAYEAYKAAARAHFGEFARV